MAGDILHFSYTFFLEFRVAYRQDLVHDQNLVCAYPKSQSSLGLRAAPLTCIVPDAAPFGPTFLALPLAFPSFRFPPGQFRMKPYADLEQQSNPPTHLDLPRTLRRDSRKNL